MSRNGGQSHLKFKYNADGIRTSKTVNGVEHIYTLSGTQIISEAWGENLLIYLYDENSSPIGMQYRTASYAAYTFDTFYFEKNLQGDIIAVYNANGTKVLSYTYDAWGNHSTTWHNRTGTNLNAIYNPFRYRGYYYDTETQLYYLQSRYYNPQWGRFLNVDAYISTGTGLIGYNMYTYCNNNPVMKVDPSGYLGLLSTCDLEEGYDILRDESEIGAGSAYHTYVVRSATATYDAQLYGYYYGGMTSAANSIFGYYVPGAVTVTDDMTIQKQKHSMQDIVAKGKAGEAAVEGFQNHERIPSASGKTTYRVPDRLDWTKRIIGEIKNHAGKLSYTSQLRDYVSFAKEKGLTFYLYTNAELSKPLQKLVAEGVIVHCPIKFD